MPTPRVVKKTDGRLTGEAESPIFRPARRLAPNLKKSGDRDATSVD